MDLKDVSSTITNDSMNDPPLDKLHSASSCGKFPVSYHGQVKVSHFVLSVMSEICLALLLNLKTFCSKEIPREVVNCVMG